MSRRTTKIRAAALLTVLSFLPACSVTPPDTIQGALTGIGGNAGRGAVSAWSVAWSDAVKGTYVSYSPDGPSAGLKAFRDGQAHFAVSSAPLSEKDASEVRGMCTSAGAMSVAAGVLPVGVAVKIEDVSELILDAETLAGILKGDITRWNDPLLEQLNPETALPDLAITVVVPEGPSDIVRPVNQYLSQGVPSLWKPSAPDTLPSDVVGQDEAPPLDMADELDGINGGLSILDGSIIGNRFTAAQLMFDGEPRRLQASSVVDAVTSGNVVASPTSVTQELDDRSGYALGTIIYLHLCRDYSEEALGRLTRSFGQAVLSDDAQKNANTFAFVMSPSKKAVSEGLALVNTIGDGQ